MARESMLDRLLSRVDVCRDGDGTGAVCFDGCFVILEPNEADALAEALSEKARQARLDAGKETSNGNN